jgi:hypothetical protein
MNDRQSDESEEDLTE